MKHGFKAPACNRAPLTPGSTIIYGDKWKAKRKDYLCFSQTHSMLSYSGACDSLNFCWMKSIVYMYKCAWGQSGVKKILGWKFGRLNLDKNGDVVRLCTVKREPPGEIKTHTFNQWRHSDWRDNEKGMKTSHTIDTVRQQLRCWLCRPFLIRQRGERQTSRAKRTPHNSY